MFKSVVADICCIFNASTLAHAQLQLDTLIEKYRRSAPEHSNCMRIPMPDGFEVFYLRQDKRRRLRTSNAYENLNNQIERRTKIAEVFHTQANSILRLSTVILIEISKELEASKLTLSPRTNTLVKRINNYKALSSSLDKLTGEKLLSTACSDCAQASGQL
jgi:transposase-like protein